MGWPVAGVSLAPGQGPTAFLPHRSVGTDSMEGHFSAQAKFSNYGIVSHDAKYCRNAPRDRQPRPHAACGQTGRGACRIGAFPKRRTAAIELHCPVSRQSHHAVHPPPRPPAAAGPPPADDSPRRRCLPRCRRRRAPWRRPRRDRPVERADAAGRARGAGPRRRGRRRPPLHRPAARAVVAALAQPRRDQLVHVHPAGGDRAVLRRDGRDPVVPARDRAPAATRRAVSRRRLGAATRAAVVAEQSGPARLAGARHRRGAARPARLSHRRAGGAARESGDRLHQLARRHAARALVAAVHVGIRRAAARDAGAAARARRARHLRHRARDPARGLFAPAGQRTRRQLHADAGADRARQRVPRHARGALFDQRHPDPSAAARADRALPLLADRQEQPAARQHLAAAGARHRAVVRGAARPAGPFAVAARRCLSARVEPAQQHAAVAGGRAVVLPAVEPVEHVAAYQPPLRGAARAAGRDLVPPRDGKLDADRAARARPERAHHLCESGLLPHDRLAGARAGRARAALPPTGRPTTSRRCSARSI
ncbi:hypothetical protein OJJOAM_000514 [Cupriavidus sp. H18C1]